MSDDLFLEFLSDVKTLHWCETEEVYETKLAAFRARWAGTKMLHYCEKEWLTAPFNRWQIFRNLPGYANTNSNIESFNATIKRDMTLRVKLSMYSILIKMRELILFYSTNKALPFQTMPAFDNKLKTLAVAIPESSFKFITTRKVECEGENKRVFKIRLDHPSCYRGCYCDCKRFCKWAICVHVVAYSNTYKEELYGAKWFQPENFVKKPKKGAKVKARLGGRPAHAGLAFALE